MLTLQEIKMLRFMNELTDVEEWFIKVRAVQCVKSRA